MLPWDARCYRPRLTQTKGVWMWGEPVAVTGPAGKRFLLPEDPSQHDFLFLATGLAPAELQHFFLHSHQVALCQKALHLGHERRLGDGLQAGLHGRCKRGRPRRPEF